MALVPSASTSALVELEPSLSGILSAESMATVLHSQKELFHSQIAQLEQLVVTQCRLTGVNPLAQEMAAGALSIKIGKKPRDLLNPKAVKYMQSIFSIKDNIGKKETREISALCGVTVTQVRDFFASQRSRVRKLVRLSHEKATKIEASKPSKNNNNNNNHNNNNSINTNNNVNLSSTSYEQPPPNITNETPIGTSDALSVVGPAIPAVISSVVGPMEIPIIAATKDISVHVQGQVQAQAQQTSVNPADVNNNNDYNNKASKEREGEEGIGEEDKKFLEDIFALMRREESFSGQVRLMESVLQINNTAVLHWFLEKGGLTILADWLCEATTEEQTSVIIVILKVLCHLPLHKALPVQMSAVLQTVNKLRFYRASDVSNRAKVLLSRWSKILRTHLLKKSPKDSKKDLIRKQRIREILSDEAWKSELGFPEDILALTENGEDIRKTEPKRVLKLMAAPYDDSNKKNGTGITPLKTKERRKVLLVEQLERKNSVVKNALAATRIARTVPTSSNQSRPLSADDIQKAKLRASFMQKNKLQDNKQLKIPPLKAENQNQNLKPVLRVINKTESSLSLMDKLKRNQILWRTPPEVKLDPTWQVCSGENSKERDIQSQRIRRERETFYETPQEIPPNPKDPWDTEMDFDDSLTPEIPIEQPPDADESQAAASSSQPSEGVPAPPEADLELLAVLLKNPDLVFALTSGQGKGLSSEQTVALLDLVKRSGVGLSDLVNSKINGSGERAQESESIPTSLPSPTPPAERANWRSDFQTVANPPPVMQTHVQMHNPIIPQTLPPNTVAPASPFPPVSGLTVQTPATVLSLPQLPVTLNPPAQQQYATLTAVPNRVNHQQIVPSQLRAQRPLPVEPNAFGSGGLTWIGTGQTNSNLLEASIPNSQFVANQNGYNSYTIPGQTWDRNQGLGPSSSIELGRDRPMEMWSGWGYNEQRTDIRPNNHSNRNDYGSSSSSNQRWHNNERDWRR